MYAYIKERCYTIYPGKLTDAEHEALSAEDKAAAVLRVREFYENCGADYVISNMSDLPALIEKIQKS